MLTEIVFAPKRGDDPTFSLFFGLFAACIVILLILWNRRYRHEWEQFRAKGWPKVEGIFVSGEGEVVTMRRGSSKTVAGYEAWLYYEYQCDGEQDGIYRRFFSTKPDAEAFLKLLEGQNIPVRVKHRKPSRSYILDRDIEFLTQPFSNRRKSAGLGGPDHR